jgi:site-specific DNA recombinase
VEGGKEKMKTAAIYCRVSTDSQEREGTSLQTQLEHCLNYCKGKGYDVSHRFSEAYSGLSLERPELDKLRDLVRAEAIDVVVIYGLDRFTRNPNHGVILQEECEKHHVSLEAVSEDIDNSELGNLISYIRGYANKQETEKLKDRARRGKRARARAGRIPSGGGSTIYGCDYIKVSQENGGRRVVNEIEASWVQRMYGWLINEGLSTNAIVYRLRALNVPTKSGKIWAKNSVQKILTNLAYTGKFYAFTTTGHKRFSRPQSDWIEIEGVTPMIISQETFEAAQRQLQINRTKTVPSTKYQYLLRGHLRCAQCGRAFAGRLGSGSFKKGKHPYRTYRCMGNLRMYAPIERCQNKGWSASKLERIVWAEIERYLSKPELIISELERQRQDTNQLEVFETELQQIERQLRAVDQEQHQLLQWAIRGFPESQVETENKRLNKARETLTARKTELQARIKACQDAIINVPNLEAFIEQIQAGITTLDFEGKRLALDMLNITVWLDGENIEVTGIIEPEKAVARCTSKQDRSGKSASKLVGGDQR